MIFSVSLYAGTEQQHSDLILHADNNKGKKIERKSQLAGLLTIQPT